MSRKNVAKVFNAWVAGKACIGSRNHYGTETIWTDGRTIFSYAMPIAVKTGANSAVITEDTPSVTTSIHRNQVRYQAHINGIKVEHAPSAEIARVHNR